MKIFMVVILMIYSIALTDEFVKDFGEYKCKFKITFADMFKAGDRARMAVEWRCNSTYSEVFKFTAYDKDGFVIITNNFNFFNNPYGIEIAYYDIPTEAVYYKINAEVLKRMMPKYTLFEITSDDALTEWFVIGETVEECEAVLKAKGFEID